MPCLQGLSTDPRPEIRNSGMRTFFTVVVSQGAKLTPPTWDELLWEMMFPLLQTVHHMSATSSKEEVIVIVNYLMLWLNCTQAMPFSISSKLMPKTFIACACCSKSCQSVGGISLLGSTGNILSFQQSCPTIGTRQQITHSADLLYNCLLQAHCELNLQANPEVLGKLRGVSVKMLVHHSRNSEQKQWDETLVLALNGMVRLLKSHLPLLLTFPAFAEVSHSPAPQI